MLTKKSGTSLLGIRSGAVWIIIYNYFIIIFFYRIVLSSLCVPYILPQTIMRTFLYNTPMTNSTTPEERTTCTFWYVSFYILNPLQKVNLKSKKVIIFYHFALFWSHDHVNYCIKHIQCLNFKSNAEAILKVIKKISSFSNLHFNALFNNQFTYKSNEDNLKDVYVCATCYQAWYLHHRFVDSWIDYRKFRESWQEKRI